MNSKDLAELNKMYSPEMLSKLLASRGSSSGSVANTGSTVNSGSSGSENKQIAALDANYKAQSDLLRTKYMTAGQQLNESRTRSKKEAGINHTKLMKYMPSILKRQGLSGLGVSQSAVISANNNYLGALTDIENNYQQNSADLLKNYSDAKLQYDTQYNTQKAQLEQAEIDKAEAEKEKAEAKTAAEQSNNYKNAYDIIVNDKISTDFTALLETYKGIVSEADYNTLVQLAATQAAANQKRVTDETNAKTEAEFESNFEKAYAIIINDNITTDFTEFLSGFEVGKNISESGYATLQLLAASQAAANQAAIEENNDGYVLDDLLQLEALGDWEKALEVLEAVKGQMSSTRYAQKKALYESYLGKSGGLEDDEVEDPNSPNINQTGEAYDNMSQAEKDERIISGKDNVSYKGQDYQLMEKLDASSPFISNNIDFTAKLAEEGFNSEYNLGLKDGLTINVVYTKDGQWTDWNSYTDKAGFTTENYNKKTAYLTYYKGEWYISKHKGGTSKTAPSANSDPLGLYAQQWYSNSQGKQNGNNNLLNYVFSKK